MVFGFIWLTRTQSSSNVTLKKETKYFWLVNFVHKQLFHFLLHLSTNNQHTIEGEREGEGEGKERKRWVNYNNIPRINKQNIRIIKEKRKENSPRWRVETHLWYREKITEKWRRKTWKAD